MRELLVLRHAKSSWDAIDAADHDRELSARGIKAAGKMGALIAERGWLPDRILCSTAKRTRETLSLAQKAWPASFDIAANELASLYLATPSRLLEIVRRQPDEARRLMLIGHNPGLQTFVLRLAGGGDRKLRAAIEAKFPTAALARLTFEVESWRDLGWGDGLLADYQTPKDD
jgi:phosphohistidine phosphatase